MPTSAARLDQALRLGPRARVVQHATLRTATPDEQAPLRFALEDALATAEFGDCGRLVLVRRLQLPTLPRHAGPQGLARALEQAWRAVAARALPAAHPQAAEAPAVYFASPFEARLQWLHRVARQRPTRAWFWRAALPELGRAGSAPAAAEVADTVASALLHEAPEPARQALLQWTDTELRTLAHTLGPAVLGAWQRRLVAAAPAAPAQDGAALAPAPTVRDDTAALQAVAQRLAAVVPATPAAAAWLAALWLPPVLGRAASAGQVQQVLARLTVLQPVAATQAPSASGPGGASPAVARAPLRPDAPPSAVAPGPAPPTRTAAHPTTEALHHPAGAATPPASADAPTPPPLAASLQAPATPRAAPRPPRRAPALGLPWLADARFSAHAGLLLVLNALGALQFDPWLQQQPAALRQPLADALMGAVLDHSGAPPHDPQRAWLALDAATLQALASARLDQGTRTLAQVLRRWLLTLRRALRRRAGLDLAALVRRPGWVSASATHLDVVYALDDADLRLRRHGLDADPGWVPWFGRIVALHFLPREHLPAPDDPPGHG